MVNPLVYLQQVRQELQRVTWPTREETMSMTILVLVVSTALGLYLAGLDFLFNELLAIII